MIAFLSWTNGGILCLKVERQSWELSFWTQQYFHYGKFLGCSILCLSGSHHLQLQVSQLTWVIEVELLHVAVGFQIFLESARHRLCGTILMLSSPNMVKSFKRIVKDPWQSLQGSYQGPLSRSSTFLVNNAKDFWGSSKILTMILIKISVNSA